MLYKSAFNAVQIQNYQQSDVNSYFRIVVNGVVNPFSTKKTDAFYIVIYDDPAKMTMQAQS